MRRSFPSARIADVDPHRGLREEEISARAEIYGANDIVEAARGGWRVVLRDTLADPMVWFLLGTSALFGLLGEYVEAAVLGLALVPIMAMDAYLHQRTQALTVSLSGRLATSATVIRNGVKTQVLARSIVTGDIAIVSEGAPFPADGLVIAGENLQVDESALTGESMPVRKKAFGASLPQAGEIAPEGDSWGAAGTRLLTGEATMRVVFTGADTLYGQIVRSVRAGRQEKTPLQMAIGDLVRLLLIIAGLLCVALALIRFQQGYGVVDAILSAVTLAIAALPEEFPVVFTFFLGVGVYRLARRQALVRRAVVVENIGRVSVICTDKTGTLTEGRLQIAHVIPAGGADATQLLSAASLAARAESSDPVDALLLSRAPQKKVERLAVFPFTEDRRRETAIVRSEDGVMAAMKGAPETVLGMTVLSEQERSAQLETTRALAASGHKVIGASARRLSDEQLAEPDHGYDFLGLIAFEDPVREGVAAAVKSALAANIRVVMVTGDHPATALAIAREVGIGGGAPRVLGGAEFLELQKRGGASAVTGIDVIARALPAHKLTLVNALQKAGEIVAVTGDGVNDVPALKGADIGIAMGERGADAAREVASIVLLDDNFRTIVRAIAEGRQLFRNLKLSFAYLLMVHAPLVASAALIPLAGYPLLYLPIHIVWLELIIHPTALLVFQELPAGERLAPDFGSKKLSFFNPREWTGIALVGLGLTALVLLGYFYGLGPENDVEHARSFSLVALIAGSAMATAVLSGLRTISAIIATALAVVSAIVLVQTPHLSSLLHVSPLHADDWIIAVVGGAFAGAFAFMTRRQP